MSRSIEIINKISETIKSIKFKEESKQVTTDFTRNRKVDFEKLIHMILRPIKRSLQIEIDEFTSQYIDEEIGTYTKQSFSEARQKLKPKAFKILNDVLIEEYYKDRKREEYRILAIDGSKIQIPNNIKTREYFGYITNNHKEFSTAQGLGSVLYDVENKIILDAQLSRCDASERKLAMKNIEKMLVQSPNAKNLILFDRGYPCFELIKFLEDKSQKYLMRVKSNFFLEVNNTMTEDELVTITITPSRKKHFKQQGFDAQTGWGISVRVVKFDLPSGEKETLITNLDNSTSFEECKALYFKRWGIETNYDDLKNKFEIENFSGDSVRVIEQDFFATLLLSNIATIIAQDAYSKYISSNTSKKNTPIR